MTSAARLGRAALARVRPPDRSQQKTHVEIHHHELRMTTPVRGTLEEHKLESVFHELHAKQASGVLHVMRDGLEKRIYFRRGRIVSAASDAEEDDFGRSLLARGKLEPQDLDMACRAKEKTGQPLPDVLSDLLLLPAPELERAAAELERTILYSVLGWSNGEFRFEESPELGDGVLPRLDLSPDDVVHAMPRGAPLEPVVHWARYPKVPLAEATLSTKESALLDLLRAPEHQGLTTSQIIEQSPLSDEETVHVLTKLIAAGVLEVRDPPPPEDFSQTLAGRGLPASPTPATGAPLPFPARIGRFVVERALGRGSMGAVLLAKDPAIDRTVAIKLIQTASHLPDGQLRKYHERFYREASAAGQLVHPAIATVFDVGHSEDGTPFIVMEYVKGETLRELLEHGRLDRKAALGVAGDVLEALSFAHSQGIVHRDVKPTNVMVTPDFRAKIMDFGIAHVVGSELTSADDVLGSPYYMAPEQLSKGPIGPETDLFSFGVMLYRMLTGDLPFTGDSFAAIAHAILHETPAAPHRLDRSIPRALSQVVLRCLEKSPGARFESAAEVLRALAAAETAKEEARSGIASYFASRGRKLALVVVLATANGLALRLAVDPPLSQGSPVPNDPAPAVPAVEAPIAAVDLPPLAPPDAGVEPEAPPTHPVRSEPSNPKPTTIPSAPPKAHRPTTQAPAPRAAEPLEPQPSMPRPPSEAELFYEARILLERGMLEESQVVLERLLELNPTFVGAAELRQQVADQIWERDLPLVLGARHNHRLGGCQGELSLASIGIRYRSSDHDWAFAREDIRVLERPDPRTLFVETYEKDTFSFGKNKRYKFELEAPFTDSDWTRYQRLIK